MAVSKRNRRGMLWLLIVAFLVTITPRILSQFQDEIHINESEFQLLKMEFSEKVGDQSDYRIKSNVKKYRKKYKSPSSKFDPNSYKLSDWMRLGLSQKQAEIILKFTNRGIENNDELKNIFVINDDLFALIKDSTVYPAKVVKEKTQVKEVQTVDLNSASIEQIDELPGIGEYYSKKIVDYREKLGGFIRKEQLLEIWKFDPEVFERIKDRIVIVQEVSRIDINKVTIDELKLHPYISYKQANSIVKMREQHGLYKSVEDIKRSKLIDNETYQKLKDYLKVE
jgi:competence protein ComEA